MKNLANFKIQIRTREYLIQAIYQISLITKKCAISLINLKMSIRIKRLILIHFLRHLESINNNKKKIEEILTSLELKIQIWI
jgi:hypothetical protein